MAGGFYQQKKGSDEEMQVFLSCVIYLCFGTVIIILVWLYELWIYIDCFFQIRFWFSFYCMKTHYSLSKLYLEQINKNCIFVKNTESLRDKIYRNAVRAINKRNSYIYVDSSV